MVQINVYEGRGTWGAGPAAESQPLPVKTVRVSAEELRAGALRVTCKNPDCQAWIEVPVDRLDRQFPGLVCPCCRANVGKAGPRPDPLTRLAEVLRELSDPSSQMTVEFVLPGKALLGDPSRP